MARALVCARVQYIRYDQRSRGFFSEFKFYSAQLCRGARSERVRAMGTRVVCRVRPPSCRAAVPSPVSSRAESSEILVASPATASVSPGGATTGGSPPPSSSPTQTHAFVFDGVFDGGATDDDVSRACLDPRASRRLRPRCQRHRHGVRAERRGEDAHHGRRRARRRRERAYSAGE